MNKPTEEAKRLSYEIADEYLPDTHVNGMDCPDTQLADEIINKILDAIVNAGDFLPYSDPMEGQQTAYNHAIEDYQEAINKLRP